MTLEIRSSFNTAVRSCFHEASSIFQSIEGEFSQWQDSKGQKVQRIIENEKKQFQLVLNEAKNVRNALKEIEAVAEKVEGISRKK